MGNFFRVVCLRVPRIGYHKNNFLNALEHFHGKLSNVPGICLRTRAEILLKLDNIHLCWLLTHPPAFWEIETRISLALILFQFTLVCIALDTRLKPEVEFARLAALRQVWEESKIQWYAPILSFCHKVWADVSQLASKVERSPRFWRGLLSTLLCIDVVS